MQALYNLVSADRISSTARSRKLRLASSLRSAIENAIETVIGLLEDAEDWQFEAAAVIAVYDAQTAVERELVLLRASVLGRLCSATIMETDLFEIQAEHLREYRQGRQLLPNSPDVVHPTFERTNSANHDRYVSQSGRREIETLDSSALKSDRALDRLSHYEASLRHQAGQILFALDALDRRKPQFDRGEQHGNEFRCVAELCADS